MSVNESLTRSAAGRDGPARGPVVRARFPGLCPVCQRAIVPGAMVVHRAGRWVHTGDCAHVPRALLARCGATNVTNGRPCRNAVVAGELCPVHRWDGPVA